MKHMGEQEINVPSPIVQKIMEEFGFLLIFLGEFLSFALIGLMPIYIYCLYLFISKQSISSSLKTKLFAALSVTMSIVLCLFILMCLLVIGQWG